MVNQKDFLLKEKNILMSTLQRKNELVQPEVQTKATIRPFVTA